MDKVKLLADAKMARKYLNKVIVGLEEDAVSFLGPAVSLEQQTVELFIERKLGRFQADLLTAGDMCETLHDPSYESFLLVPAESITPVKIGRMARKLTGMNSRTVATKNGTKRICIIRNKVRYSIGGESLLGVEYDIQNGNCTE